MEVGFTEDQALFRDVVRRFLEDKSPPTEVRRQMVSEQGYNAAVWTQACGEVGLAGIHIPEKFGGSGFGSVELGIVAEEMGRHLYCGPFFASAVMAGYAILNEATDQQKHDLLPAIADGTCIASLVLDDLGDVRRVGSRIKADEHADGMGLTGYAPMVIDAQTATHFVVAAASGDTVRLYHLEADAPGVSVLPLEVMDPTRKLCRVEFDNAVAEPLGSGMAANLDKLWDQMCAVLSNEMVGGAAHLFETTLDYMKLRVQFGRTIGSFQALKHRCADLLMELELARAAAYDATRALAQRERGERCESYASNMSKAMASDAYLEVAKAAIQLRGGIGFTWEEDTHLWFKRAKSSEVLFGTSVWHREEMIRKVIAAAQEVSTNV